MRRACVCVPLKARCYLLLLFEQSMISTLWKCSKCHLLKILRLHSMDLQLSASKITQNTQCICHVIHCLHVHACKLHDISHTINMYSQWWLNNNGTMALLTIISNKNKRTHIYVFLSRKTWVSQYRKSNLDLMRQEKIGFWDGKCHQLGNM